MRGGLAWVLVAGCGFSPSGVAPDARAMGPGSDMPGATDDAGTAIDAARPASALACPSGAGWFQVAGQTSWYFEDTSGTSWTDAETKCEALQLAAGSAIHLAVLDTKPELDAVAAHDTSRDFWIGMFQPAHQATPAAGWLWITGAPGITGAWSSGEPNDDGGIFSQSDHENDDEDFGELYPSNATLNDEGDGNGDAFLCECDGVAVPAAVRAQIP